MMQGSGGLFKTILIDYLEVVISGHTEHHTGNSMSRHLSPVTSETYAIRETFLSMNITSTLRM